MKLNMVDSLTLRQIWLSIVGIQTNSLLELSDLELTRQIQDKLEQQNVLTAGELKFAQTYIQSRILLIRELAESQLGTV
ncbi:MAG: hypothetical protein QNJ55_03730 [Xenococcus sp. MO_188.B8]|nr:hypothetical protein [Xenococcus sp. MO_188.B8]